MLAAIGITLILKQIPHAFGYDKDFMGDIDFWQTDGENTFSEIVKALGSFHPGALDNRIDFCGFIDHPRDNSDLKK